MLHNNIYRLAIPNGSVSQYQYVDEPFSQVETVELITYCGWINKCILLDKRKKETRYGSFVDSRPLHKTLRFGIMKNRFLDI